MTASMPRVTMKGGSLIRVTSRPETVAISVQATRPARIETAGGIPPIVSLVSSNVPNTAIAALARSMPAVRMISVWPRASVPMTTDCWTINEKLSTLRNVLVESEKKTITTTRAAVGPRTGLRAKALRTESPRLVCCFCGALVVAVMSAPAVLGTPGGVLGGEALHGLVSDQHGPGVHETGRLHALLRVRADGVDALLGHLLGELHDGGHEQAVLDVLHALAAAVDRADDDLAVQALLLQRLVRAPGGRLVDVVDHVDLTAHALQQVLHLLLGLGLVTLGERAPDDGGRLQWQAHPLEEPVVALDADRGAGVEVHGDDLGFLAAHRGLDVLAEELAGLLVVGRVRRRDRVGRVGRGVQRDDHDTRVLGRLDRVQHTTGVARSDQDALDALLDQVLDRGDLAGVVTVELAGQRDQAVAVLLRCGLGRLAQLDEVRVALRLGDHLDLDRAGGRGSSLSRARSGGLGGAAGAHPERGHRDECHGHGSRSVDGSHAISPGGQRPDRDARTGCAPRTRLGGCRNTRDESMPCLWFAQTVAHRCGDAPPCDGGCPPTLLPPPGRRGHAGRGVHHDGLARGQRHAVRRP